MKILQAKTQCQLSLVRITPSCAICNCGRSYTRYFELGQHLHIDSDEVRRYHREYLQGNKPLYPDVP